MGWNRGVNKMKTVMTVTGIRPDFIRMKEVFRKLDSDNDINHILVHTGQHYNNLLSDVFFKDLKIRKPDYNLHVGGDGKEHFHQTADLSVKLIDLIRTKNINPDLILFLGDSNSVVSAVPLKKEGYKIGHIEAGMRSYDKRMLEEINRVVCDHCTDIHFVYHGDYKKHLVQEGFNSDNIHIVGNTIVEVCKPIADELKLVDKKNSHIILDIHRPENFKYANRLSNIIKYANLCIDEFELPVKMLEFKRTTRYLKEYNIDIGNIEIVDLMSYKEYLESVYHSKFIISDSGTAQEEPALLGTKVIVPRDYTERPQSMSNNCSYMLEANTGIGFKYSFNWLNSNNKINSLWLGRGEAAENIIGIIKEM